MDTLATPPALSNDLRDLATDLFDRLRAQSFDGVGITRATYGDGETEAMKTLAAVATNLGLVVSYDAAANLLIDLPGSDPSLPVAACGSHLDSVPQGGNFDGAAGVIAGLLALARVKTSGITPARGLRVYALRGEESAWFGKCYLGSMALFGQFDRENLTLEQRDTGETLESCMRACGADLDVIAAGTPIVAARDIACFLELHIEQGPVMVARGIPVGLVTGIRGNVRHPRAVCRGSAAHSGAVPRWLRHDAVFAASELVMRFDEHWKTLLEQGQDLVLTLGILGTNPEEHAMSRVPGEVRFSLEFRSQAQDVLEGFERLIWEEGESIGRGRGVEFDFGPEVRTPPAVMHEGLVAHMGRLCAAAGIPHETLPSGAGHDAAIFANAGVPTGMIFVRNEHGSHNPHEAMDLEDFFLGAEVLFQTLTTAPENL